QIRQGGRVPDQGSRRAAGVLRLPGRALEASAHDERRNWPRLQRGHFLALGQADITRLSGCVRATGGRDEHEIGLHLGVPGSDFSGCTTCRNTRYQAGATPYLGRTSTGWIAPACGWRTHSITSSAVASSLSEAERLGGLEVGQLEFDRLLDGKIGRLGTLTLALACASIFQGVPRLAGLR